MLPTYDTQQIIQGTGYADLTLDWGVPHNALHEMMRVTGCFENHKSANPPMLFHRLADIIDPTCHNKQIEINKMAPLEFRVDTLKRYDADFLADFARNRLSIDPFKFLKNVPIFEIENMQLYVYMPPVDDFGNLQIGDDRIGYVDVTAEITVITVDMGSEDFEKCTKAIFAAIWSSGIETEHERIDDLGEVDEPCTIVTSIDEHSDGTTVYGYNDTPKSQVTRNSIPLMIEHNKELARRLYCGKVWTCDALKFAETYYEHRDN